MFEEFVSEQLNCEIFVVPTKQVGTIEGGGGGGKEISLLSFPHSTDFCPKNTTDPKNKIEHRTIIALDSCSNGQTDDSHLFFFSIFGISFSYLGKHGT